MESNLIKCPHCGKDIEVTEVLTHSIRESMRNDMQEELARKEQGFAAEQAAFKAREKELSAKEQSIEKQIDEKLKTERAKLAQDKKAVEIQQEQIDEQVAAKVKLEKQRLGDEALKKAREETAEQTAAMQAELEEQKKKNKDAQKRELELLKKQQELESKEESLELELHRKMNEERKKIFAEAKKKASEEQELKTREKDDLLKQMQAQVEILQRRLEVGSQEAQGEALEGSLKDKLSQMFPFDVFEDVKKGAQGADICQLVRNNFGKECGTILWEAKNAQQFSNEWIQKLKKDQQEAGADIAVIATVTLPKEIGGFGLVDDVWVTDYKTAMCLAMALRNGLINVAREKMVVANQSTVKDVVYRYVTSKEFTLQIKSVVAAFERMRDDLESEKRAMQKYWKSREKQIETVLGSVSNIYGAIEGYVGQKQLPQIDPLMLESIGEDEEPI